MSIHSFGVKRHFHFHVKIKGKFRSKVGEGASFLFSVEISSYNYPQDSEKI